MAVGYPDYTKAGAPTRLTLGENQERFIQVAGASISAGGSGTLTVTATSSQRIFISAITYTCEVSVIQEGRIQYDSTIVARRFFDITGDFTPPDGGSYVIEAGGSLSFIVVNNDSSARSMYITLFGMKETID